MTRRYASRVWKRLKLLTLVVVTVLMAWVTYPTWMPLFQREHILKTWASTDTIQFIFLGRSIQRPFVELRSSYPDSTETSLDITMKPVRGHYPPHDEGPLDVYISATGAAVDWLQNCASTADSSNPQLVPLNSADPVMKSLSEQVVGRPLWARKVHFRSGESTDFGCSLPAEGVWTPHGDGLVQFAVPTIEVMDDANIGPDACLEVGVQYPGQYAVAYNAYNGVSIDTSFAATSGFSSAWRDCPPDAELGLQLGTYVLSNIQLGLTDTIQVAQLNRSLFFAGIFAGLLGALGIEIFNSVFDVVETRRARSEDEQESDPAPIPTPTPDPPPESDDETYDPGPRGYL